MLLLKEGSLHAQTFENFIDTPSAYPRTMSHNTLHELTSSCTTLWLYGRIYLL